MKRAVLVASAVLILGVAIALLVWMREDGSLEPEHAQAATRSTPSTSAQRQATTTTTRRDGVALPAPASAERETTRGDDPPELAIQPIARAQIQRETGDGPLERATIQALRSAAAPAVQRCIGDSLARNPSYRSLEDPLSLSITYYAAVAAGALTVTKAKAVVQNTQDDELVACVETAARSIHAGVGQGDAASGVQLVFEYK